MSPFFYLRIPEYPQTFEKENIPDDFLCHTLAAGMTTEYSNAARTHSEFGFLEDRYSPSVFRGTMKPREGNQRFGRLTIDAETSYQLGSTNVGLFVECCPGLERMVQHLVDLNESAAGRWIVVSSSKQVDAELQYFWQSENLGKAHCAIEFTTPELLSQIKTSHADVAGILVIDFACHIHKCRGYLLNRFGKAHDRPQKIVDFRVSQKVGQWSPPIIFFTPKPAISVNTHNMLSPYCLEAFRYIDGRTMKFGTIPIFQDDSLLVG